MRWTTMRAGGNASHPFEAPTRTGLAARANASGHARAVACGLLLAFGVLAAPSVQATARGAGVQTGGEARQTPPRAERELPAPLRQAAERYGRDEWVRGPGRDGLPITTLELDGWQRGQLSLEGRTLLLSFRPAGSDEGARPAFVLEAFVGIDAREAQLPLLSWLSGLQGPIPAPAASERGIEVGEVAYAGPSGEGENQLSWVAFVRGNVAVRVAAAWRPAEGLDLGAIAKELDRALLDVPLLAEGRAPTRASLRELRAEATELTAGEATELIVEFAAPLAAGAHFEWTVGGPGQGYVERGRDGRWRLHTTKAGRITLGLELAAANGTVTRRSLDLTVAED